MPPDEELLSSYVDVGSASSQVIEIYKVHVELADRVSQRRQAANNFFLTVSAAVSAFPIIDGRSDSGLNAGIFISVAGILIAFTWMRSITSYKELNEAKFKVINRIEDFMPLRPFNQEWTHLNRGKGRYKPFHKVEILIPWLFVGLHLAAITYLADWSMLRTEAEGLLFGSSVP